MYEYLSGTISELAPTHAVLDVGGVGYFLQISLQTYSEIEHSDRVKLFVHYVVREDAQLLYGFANCSASSSAYRAWAATRHA